MEIEWKIKKGPPKNFFAKFKNYHPLLLTLLWHKNIVQKKDIDNFLFPKFENFKKNDPFLFSDFTKAVNLLKEALSKKHKICIYGDFDFDGISSAIILKAYLDKIGLSSFVYIPDREKEGYGLNMKAVKFLKSIGIKLLITVDCGISNNKEILYAKKLNLKTIIIDHHLINLMPKADAIINPHRKDDKYPFKKLSCAGLVLKVCMGLAKTSEFNKLIPKNYYREFLDLAALATIADYMDLIDENRELVLLGLKQIVTNTRPSIKEILKRAHLNMPSIKFDRTRQRFFIEDLTSETVKFFIAPRINVASRIDHSAVSYKFLTATSLKELKKYGDIIENFLKQRQSLENKFLNQIYQYIFRHKLDQKSIITIPIENFPIGLLGMIASKIVDIYQKPTILISIKHSICRGSGRSTENFSIINLLKKSKKFLFKYGGHRRACGFELKDANLKPFIKHIDILSKKLFSSNNQKRVLEIDYKLKPEEINENLLEVLKYIEPTGDGNSEPIFLVQNAVILKKTALKNYTRILLQITDSKQKVKYLDAIIPRQKIINPISHRHILKNKAYNLAVKIKEQSHQNLKNILLYVIGLKPL